VSHDWGVHNYLVNTDDATLAFLDNVLDEVADLFPGPYIHIGGDEAVKDQWKASPRVQARMRALGLDNENALQGWFVAQIANHLAARGKRIVGWDEILEAGVPPNAIVMSWRGAKGGIAAAHAGHDVVMTPDPDLYLDHLQSDAEDEPAGRPTLRTLADIYAFDPVPADMPADVSAHVLGAEGALWTEHMRTESRVEHAAFPRLDALAEALWSPRASHGWRGFVDRLVAQMDRHRALGTDAAESAFAVRVSATYDLAQDRVEVALSDQAGLPIRYTLDGSAPSVASTLYSSPISLPVPSTVRAASFARERAVAGAPAHALSREAARRRTSAELSQCSGKITLRLEDDAPAAGPRPLFNVDLFDPCWLWPKAPLDGIDGITARVGQLPFNFQLAQDVANIVPRPAPMSPHGDLLVKLDGCNGTGLASIPLDAASRNPALTSLSATWAPIAGSHDLCFEFTGHGVDPLWAIDSVELIPSAR
ncbi:MAG TPA: family 20 glycosylhydrolase, partial [Rhodanobacteraceae bacterium]